MPVSGMANTSRSDATRWLPCTETPTPPPIVIPSISATYGLGNRLISVLSMYSLRKN
jgi:hypothetical protein